MPIATSQNAEIYYERDGAGPAVVLAHGAGGNRLSWWQQTPHFARTHTVVRIDHRSFGRSTCAAADFHPKYFAADLLAVMDAADIERAALVCQSMGGWTGLRAALEHPDRVDCLVLCDTPGGLVFPAILEAAATLGARIGSDGIRGNAALAPDFPDREPALAHLYDEINALNVNVDPRDLARLFDPESSITPEQLAGYRVPTLVIAGEHDLLFPAAALRETARLIPGAEYCEFEGCGHSVYFEDATAFNRTVGAFVDKHQQR
jgi:3-oxoadipate enol-lactonase